ncbi:MAG: cellulase family glycosylhydrolase [Holophagales bacterium]|nr:cellulase family glycosylhydrolase [Holophagales bacterium]
MSRRRFRKALLALLCLLPSPLAARSDPAIGINVHAPEKERLDGLLDRVAEAGIGWVRIDFVWAEVEPEPGVTRWRLYDDLVAAARARNLQVLALIGYTPAWATDGPAISGTPRKVSDWTDFCYRAAARYAGSIDHWEVWNEPNLTRFWSGGREAFVEKILIPAATAVRAANPHAQVGGPALAHHVAQGRDWPGWLLDVLTAAGDDLDFLTHHAYDVDDPAGVLARLEGTTPYGDDPSRWSVVPPSLREVLAVAGFHRPVWLTETGWPSTRLDESRQAAAYSRFLELWRGSRSSPPWPERVFFYELQDDADPDVPKWGLLRSGGRPKPAYRALRDWIGAAAGPGEEEPPQPPRSRPKSIDPD